MATTDRWNVSTIANRLDTKPVLREARFDELAEMLTTFRNLGPVEKDELPAWMPCSFKGTERRQSAVEAVSCFVIDVDDGTRIQQAIDLWSGYAKIVHTSWSHRPRAPKLRVVFPLARVVPAHAWKRSWGHLARLAGREGVKLDPSCNNADRLYYLPAINRECSERIGVAIEGEYLDVEWELIPDPVELRRQHRVSYHVRRKGSRPDYLAGPVRERVANKIGAVIRDNRAYHGACPQCGERSVWFYIEPDHRLSAACNHRDTCGWQGGVHLLDG